jgi:hypothetical protein
MSIAYYLHHPLNRERVTLNTHDSPLHHRVISRFPIPRPSQKHVRRSLGVAGCHLTVSR